MVKKILFVFTIVAVLGMLTLGALSLRTDTQDDSGSESLSQAATWGYIKAIYSNTNHPPKNTNN